MESKKEKFIRLAESRTNAVIDKVKLIGNLANKNNYEYTSEEVHELFLAIENELKRAKKQFDFENSSKDSKFKFSKK